MKTRKNGFTLIELLAVIVILGVLLAIAIPSVAKYINTAKKSTYIENVQSYAKAARNELFLSNSSYELPVSAGQATVITFALLEDTLENGGKKSSFGGTFNEANSFVMIVNKGDAEKPRFVYYIAALDSKGYGLGEVVNSTATAKVLEYDALTEGNVVQLGSAGISVKNAATAAGASIMKYYTKDKPDGTATAN